ncbi:RNA-directed DNA polymerase, eukaryota, reverse transcriptase zinc-binding domain protein, partial [Tanacetum coccineum]
MENGIYPTKEIRAEWSLRQMEYFYNNCHKFHLDPAYEDEEDDVNSEVDGVASDMKPEFEVNDAEVLVNDSAKAHDDQVIQLLREDAYSLCGLLETHVKKKNLNRICKRVLGNWEWVSNISSCNGGTRIIVGWDPHNVSVMVLEQSSQVLHCFVEPVNGDPSFFCSFVYAAVHTVDRRSLWKALHKHKFAVKDRPWVILGDFNACLDPSERSSGCSKVTTAMNDFRDCVSDIEVEDIAMSGLRFTWNKKPGMEGGLLKKLDRVLGNSSFMTSFPSSYAHFLPFMLSDHTPAVFAIPEVTKVKPKPFKFHNYLSSKDAFIPTVSGVWSNKVEGFSMFSLVSKLKMLKRPLRKLNFDQGNLFENVKRLRSELAIAQSSLCLDPHNRLLREVEAKTLKAYKSALKDEESFLKQKSKVEWLDEGDKNTRYFHNVVKGRLNRNRISYVEDINGNAFHGLGVGEQFVLHFKSVLGMSSEVLPIADPGSLFTKFLPESEALNMIRAVSDDEIKNALFSIDGNKAPGPDGFSAQFFKDAWSVVGIDVCKAVKDFFVNGKLLNEVNATVIALVPKIATPSKVSDYRPIACCNVVYKIISKIISNRLKNVLGLLVDENQCAFIPSRQISDNILLSQELMRGYHRDRGFAKCAFKVDIQKAYDSVEWKFLSCCLKEFGFHHTMIKWIMSCVTSPSYSINVNGDHLGYFKGMRGLRQGDPLSPYLFTLVMEVFNLVLKRLISRSPFFKYHWLCKDLKLTHLCFADDLLLFCHGDSKSAAVFKEALVEFGGMSGLLPSKIKSVVFFGNVKQASRNNILKVMPFQVGTLPVRYLGVPLISKRLYVKDCQLLIDKVKKRVFDWKNKVLSFAGRLQLVQSVLSSMQVFWSSVFILPKTIAYDIERIMRDFVWNYGEFKRGKAKVNWDIVCKPKVEGGLGIKSLFSWNIALMSKHIWNIITHKESLWVKWVNVYKLKGRSFWDIPEKAGACWAWKNLLRFRPLFRDHFVHKIGDGLSTSLWHDNWHAICPLSNFISKREILHSGLSLNCKVADVIKDGKWFWPEELVGKYDGLSVISPPCLVADKPDKVVWKNNRGRCYDFSVSEVWNDIRCRNDPVLWSKIVWFSQCVPRHSFMLWLATLGRLKTHDMMKCWDEGVSLLCVFCKKVPDNHSHLFFECEFPMQVWCYFKDLVKLDHAPNCLNDIIRLRVLSLSLNPTAQVYEAADMWNFHVSNEIGLCDMAGWNPDGGYGPVGWACSIKLVVNGVKQYNGLNGRRMYGVILKMLKNYVVLFSVSEELCEASLNDSKVKVKKGSHRKAHRGVKIKISTPGSTGVGFVLRRLRTSKVAGKARDRAEGSPMDIRGGKRVSTPMNSEINEVLTDLSSGKLNSNLKFSLGCSINDVTSVCSLNNEAVANNVSNGNDGSFIKVPLDTSPCSDRQNSPVAKSCGLKTSLDNTGMGDVGSTMCGLTSSKDGKAIAETGIMNEKGMADPSVGSNLASIEDVVSTGIGSPSSMDGIVFDKVGDKFEFGKMSNLKYSADAERFAEKLKKGSEEMSLKMEYVPSDVSKLENGNRRIMFTADEVIKGESCSLQLYGHFVGTSMDYRVVRGNLMRMWRVYDIEEITKTNSGIFYFKFKSEEGMKSVLESGPWMVQNVPLVLNVWEPGIWLEKTEPSTIPIWVCVHNIPMELCNGNGIGKIMSGIGKPMLMDKMTKERCLKKAGKLDFARVLVEISANDDLPNVLEIAYPPLGNREARIGKLEVKYQWKPPLCTHCKTFGHSTLSCKVRPRTDEERAAKIVNDASNLKGPLEHSNYSKGSDMDGFFQVGKKNKPILNPSNADRSKNINGGQSRVGQSNGNLKTSQKQDSYQMRSSFGQ